MRNENNECIFMTLCNGTKKSATTEIRADRSLHLMKHKANETN